MKPASSHAETVRAAILGADLILASLPAEPVQLVHACQALGFDMVVPASWGDEVIASGVLDELADRPPGTTILCSCPHARRRLLSAGSELAPFMVNTIAPPAAAARYLRSAHNTADLRITYIGSCPGADDESISERLTPAQFMELCREQGISITEQPRVFESCIPLDRRRYLSLPGGLPTPESVTGVRPGTDVLALDQQGLSLDIAQCVISGRAALLDITPAVGCACSGFMGESAAVDARETLAALEPPRSAGPVIDMRVPVDIEIPGQSPPYTAFEETIPLNVVFGADMASGETGVLDGHLPWPPVHRDADMPTRENQDAQNRDRTREPLLSALESAARRIELSWTESADEHPEARSAGTSQSALSPVNSPAPVRTPTSVRSEPQHPSAPSLTSLQRQQRLSATPTGTPALRTSAGSLPRAYMMFRRMVNSSGAWAAVQPQPSENAQQRLEPEIDSSGSGKPGEPVASKRSPEPTATAAATNPPDTPATRGTVDSVIDMVSKAIRAVTDPP